jgi:hypothetical protein
VYLLQYRLEDKYNEPSDKLTEVFPLGVRIGKVGPIVVWPPQLGSRLENLKNHTETTFPYGDYATFALEMLLYQRIESIEVCAWSTLELVELTRPCWMASDSCIEACNAESYL